MAGPGLSRRAKIALPVVIALLALVSWHRYAQAPERPFTEWRGEIFGTAWSVKVSAAVAPEREPGIARTLSQRLERIDALMSTWKADSELSRFNRSAEGEPFPLSPETVAVFAIAQDVSRRSGGAFDVTVGPLVDAWGFGAAGPSDQEPTDGEIALLRTRVGYALLVLDVEAGTLTKRAPGVAADLSAVAKGYAVDQVAAALEEAGFVDYLVEVGGELRGRGLRPDGSPWRVAVEEPVAAGRAIHEVIALVDGAIATSGDYRNYREAEDGRRLSHTIDPRTGRPIRHRLASVSVLHPEAGVADAWATALNVLGPTEGYLLAEREGLAAHFIVRSGDGFETRSTPAFAETTGD